MCLVLSFAAYRLPERLVKTVQDTALTSAVYGSVRF